MVYDPVHLLSLCSIAASVLYVSLGGYVLKSNPRERLNQIFALLCLSFLFWSISYAFLPGVPGKDHVWLWFRLSAPGWTVAPSLLLHFAILLSGRSRWLRRPSAVAAVYAPGIYFLLQAQWGVMGVVDFVRTPYGWSDVYGPLTPSYATYLVFAPAWILFGLALVWRWGRSSELIAERRQASLIVIVGIPVLAGVILSGIFLPWWGVRWLPEVAHLIALVWILAIWYAVAVYRLMVMTPAAVTIDILSTMTDAVLLLSRERRIVEVNEVGERLLSAPASALKGHPIQDFLTGPRGGGRLELDRLFDGKRRHALDLQIRRHEADPIPVRVSLSGVRDRHGQVVGHVLVLRDITEELKAVADLEHLATHDLLTGLPNRSLLHDRLQLALQRASRDKKPFALLMFDLDDLKQVNDAYGQRVGDAVLKSTSQRLKHCVRGLDTVCRLGGDEFMIVVEDLLKSGDSDLVAKRILAAFDEPIQVGPQSISVTASLGISTYPFDGLDSETLIKKADLALNSSKQRQKGGFQYYAPRMDAINRERTQIEQGLRLALDRGELSLVYQPLVDFDSGAIAGIEALLRWRSAEMGSVRPDKFIPVAERSGAIVPIGRWVLETACRTSRTWQRSGLPAVPIAVNVSAKQLHRRDFIDTVQDILRDTGLAASLLELELTESIAMIDVKRSQEILGALRDIGVRVVIDDFGTGYSSLIRLKLIPMDAVKVDRCFIENIARDARDRALVMAIVALARNLGVEVVAEGVETVEQLEVLRSFESQPLSIFRCDKLQGFLFSRPIARDEIPDLFSRSSALSGRLARRPSTVVDSSVHG